MSRRSFHAAESEAQKVEGDILHARSRAAVLEATLDAAERYMQALRLASCSSDKARVDAKCKELLTRAEKTKAGISTTDAVNRTAATNVLQKSDLNPPISPRKLTTREEIILLEGSKLNGFIFPPWTTDPIHETFSLGQDTEPFVDSPSLRLSKFQLKTFSGWKRPAEALGRRPVSQDGESLPREPTMRATNKIDLVQDMTSDCSVVASLCAESARSERGHSTLFSSAIFPVDRGTELSAISPSGKYIVRLYFNGCHRKVVVDDLLPTSADFRMIHMVDRSNPGLLWPPLVEKAYLKVRGGYDFPGSNSGTDLAVLTGWLPEQVFLRDDEVMPEEVWTKIYKSFTFGDVLITIGTGKLSRSEQRYHGLAAEHDYAVLDLRETDGSRKMLLKNPWSDGDMGKGESLQAPSLLVPNENGSWSSSADLSMPQREVLAPGTFWMTLGNVFQHFENLYLNWHPGLFSHRQDYHFSWDLSTQHAASGLFDTNPQFSIRCSTTGPLWLLLNRHFRTGDCRGPDAPPHGFVSLYLFDTGGRAVLLSDGAVLRGPYVDSPNTIVRFEAQANKVYTIVIAAQALPSARLNFTMSALSCCPAELSPARRRYLSVVSKLGAWTRSTAGGNSDMAGFLTNPQYSLRLSCKAEVAISLASIAPEDRSKIAMHVKVLFTDGSRVRVLRTGDLVAQSGDYRLSSAAVETTLEQGTYTIICSTFEAEQMGSFQLSVHTSSQPPAVLNLLSGEASGCLVTTSQPAVFLAGMDRLLAPLNSPRLTRASIVVQSLHSPTESLKKSAASTLKLTLEQGQGPYKLCLAESPGPEELGYGGPPGDVQITKFDLGPDTQDLRRGGLWVVLQRIVTSMPPTQIEERFQIVVMAEERVSIGAWGCGDG